MLEGTLMGEGGAFRVLFVCMGNICRSPTAEGVFRALLEREGLAAAVAVESAGTHAYHEGAGADDRSAAAAAARGVDLSRHVARRVRDDDFSSFDLILAMDRANRAELLARAPRSVSDRIRLFLPLAPELEASEVPDPYYGGPDGFDRVLDLIEAASRALLAEVRSLLGARAAGRR